MSTDFYKKFRKLLDVAQPILTDRLKRSMTWCQREEAWSSYYF
jgi:hypothetical protein